MSIDFFKLPIEIQRQFLENAEVPLSKNRNLLEKDIWLCLALRELFQLPHPMTFKGGTSLSKVFDLIKRFSEDLDITIDYRHFDHELDLSKPISRTALKKISETLRESVKEYTYNIVLPHMKKAFEKHVSKEQQPHITLSDDGEKMFIDYPSVIKNTSTYSYSTYVQARILIEFGGRNTTEPSQEHNILATLDNFNENIILPIAKVNVLSPARTFWEKATLMHVRSHKGRMDDAPDRLSRHWYDMAMLSKSWVIDEALANIVLMESVIKHNMAFYYAGYAHYEDCLSGNFKLLPEAQWIDGLKEDYQKMIEAGMFETKPLPFEEVLTRIETTQALINQKIQKNIKLYWFNE